VDPFQPAFSIFSPYVFFPLFDDDCFGYLLSRVFLATTELKTPPRLFETHLFARTVVACDCYQDFPIPLREVRCRRVCPRCSRPLVQLPTGPHLADRERGARYAGPCTPLLFFPKVRLDLQRSPRFFLCFLSSVLLDPLKESRPSYSPNQVPRFLPLQTDFSDSSTSRVCLHVVFAIVLHDALLSSSIF